MLNVLMVSIDQSLAYADSQSARRVVRYGNVVDHLMIITIGPQISYMQPKQNVEIVVLARSNKLLTLWRYVRAIHVQVGTKKWQLLTVQDAYYLGFLCWLLAWWHGLKMEVQVHGFEKQNMFRRLLTHWLLPRADSVRTVSQRYVQLLTRAYPAIVQKIVCVPVYTPVEIYQRSSYSVSSARLFTFMTVGRLVAVKNISLQIRAIHELKKQGIICRLLIVGEGLKYESLQAKTQSLEVDSLVSFIGWQNNVAPYYHESDAFLLTSDSEGWGMVVIEAAAAGLPIIMTDVGCAGEVIINNESGIVIPTGDVDALIYSMKLLIGDQSLRQKIGSHAQSAVANLGDELRNMNIYVAHWKRVIDHYTV